MALMVLSSVAKRRRRSIQEDWEDTRSLQEDWEDTRSIQDDLEDTRSLQDNWGRDWPEERLAGNN